MFISISNVYALDIQPGEWKENIEMRTINPDTKEVLMMKKFGMTLMCYTPKMSEDSKKMVKGFSTESRHWTKHL